MLSYNYGRYLGDCLASIVSQDAATEFEIIVVDDASTDDSERVAQSFADPRIRLVRHAVNLGHIATVSDGLSMARGTFVARIDCDDRYRPNYLREVLTVFRRNPEVGLVYGDVALIDDTGMVTAERADRVHGGRDFKGNELTRLLEENFICAPTVIARREAWQQTLPVPDGLAFHDWYFTLMMSRRYDFYYINQVLADYRVHAANLHTTISRNKTEEASIFRVLNMVYGEREVTPGLEERKQRVRRRVHGAQYLTLANKYFGFGMDADAQRCYVAAVGYRPEYLVQPAVVRRLLATVVGRKRYELAKSIVKSAPALTK